MTYLDGLGSLPQLAGCLPEALQTLKADAMRKLQELVPLQETFGSTVPSYDPAKFAQLGSFAIQRGPRLHSRHSFNFSAQTTLNNAMRVVRACQVPKPILLEGSPGVGKTSLVTALANLVGHELCRINLSDQTDLIDLFGSDLPVEGGIPGEFSWKDAEFLKALQEGHWVLLDEMNLAPQAVLEGLNAVLDHRGTVYIPELNRSFKRHPLFRIFAAQNPLHQGGGRKGLPKSFINRFTKVYIEELANSDLYTVCSQIFPDIEENTLRAMISFNSQLHENASVQRTFARDGSPWEFNLRDVIRWGTLSSKFASTHQPQDFLRSIYLHRFRSIEDRRHAEATFEEAFSMVAPQSGDTPPWTVAANGLQFGNYTDERQNLGSRLRPRRIIKWQLSFLESLGICVAQSWLAIVIGSKNSGKTSIVRTLAELTGHRLQEVHINHATDTMDILGSFEQVDTRRRLLALLDETVRILELDLSSLTGSQTSSSYLYHALSLQSECERATSLRFRNLLTRICDLTCDLTKLGSLYGEDYQAIHAQTTGLLSSSLDIGHFEWVDGPLVKAMKSGEWILMDGANLCSPSVLDRLNSLCEPDGFLTLNERGLVGGDVQIIRPHPRFRLFMSVDPHYGELSRAMRNRGIEIALRSMPVGDDPGVFCDYNRLPLSSSHSAMRDTSLAVIFDAIRRGIRVNEFPKMPISVSTGRGLHQDSALAYLVDQAPALLSYHLVENPISWIFFLAQNLVPQYMPHLRRFIASQNVSNSLYDFLHAYPDRKYDAVLEDSRQGYAFEKHISLAFILAQVSCLEVLKFNPFEAFHTAHQFSLV